MGRAGLQLSSGTLIFFPLLSHDAEYSDRICEGTVHRGSSSSLLSGKTPAHRKQLHFCYLCGFYYVFWICLKHI